MKLEILRRLRREALGMNRRNLEFLVPYNPPGLFAVVDYKPGTKRRLVAAGILQATLSVRRGISAGSPPSWPAVRPSS